jgi:hypothetical protein
MTDEDIYTDGQKTHACMPAVPCADTAHVGDRPATLRRAADHRQIAMASFSISMPDRPC